MLFFENINAQSYYKKNGKFGALTKDGAILTEAIYDTVYMPRFAYNEQFLITNIAKMYGAILFPTDAFPIIIEPKFDLIFYQSFCNIVIFKQGDKYGFIIYSERLRSPYVTENFSTYVVWLKNVYISNIEYDKICNQYVFIENKYGLILKGKYTYGSGTSISNYHVIPAIYDKLLYCDTKGNLLYKTYEKLEVFEDNDKSTTPVIYYLIKVIKDGYVNYLSVNSSRPNRKMYTLFPFNTYKDDEIMSPISGIFIVNQLGQPLQLYNVIDSTYKTITDEQNKALILDKYHRFSGDRWYTEDPVCVFKGESSNDKDFITIFSNVNKKENSLIFKDTIEPIFKVKYRDYYRYRQVYGLYDSYYGADKQIVQEAVFTAFISSVTDRVENLSIKDFSLISFPDKKVVYSTSFNSKNETIKINYPKPEKLECCCPYFQIVKFIVKDDKYNTTKKQVLGYINYKTFQFSKKKPEGCNDDKGPFGEMYKE